MMLDEQLDPGAVISPYLFHYEGDITGGLIVDSAGNYPLTPVGITSEAGGVSGNCLVFADDATIKYASFPSGELIPNGATYFKLSFDHLAFMAGTWSTSQVIKGQNFEFLLGGTSVQIRHYWPTAGTYTSYGWATRNKNQWYNYELTYDGSQPTNATRLNLKIDGVVSPLNDFIGSAVPSSVSNAGVLALGRSDFAVQGRKMDNIKLRLTPP